MTEATPAIEGWFTTGPEPALLGFAVHDLRHRVLPAAAGRRLLPQPGVRRRGVRGRRAVAARHASGPTPTRSTSRRRRTSRATDPYEPFALAAVELPEGLVVLGQVADGYGVADLRGRRRGRAGRRDALRPTSRRPDDLALEARGRAGRGGRPVSTRRRRRSGSACTRGASGAAPSSSTACTRPAPPSPTPASTGRDVDLVVGGETVRNGYGGYVAGATFAQALGWNGARVATSYAACATGAQALDTARARILAGLSEVALVVGADTTPKGFLAPNAGERWDDPDWLRFRLLGMTNPAYFALYARRRMDLYGATPEDFAAVKVKNARHGLENPNARYRKEVSVEDVLASRGGRRPAAPAGHLRDLRRRRRGGAHEHGVRPRARPRREPVRVKRDLDGDADASRNTVMDMPNFSTDSGGAGGRAGRARSRSRSRTRPTRRPGIGPEDVDVAEVYDLSTALELDWIRGPRRCASAARPSSCSAPATPRSAAGSRSTRPAGSPASARRCRPRRWPRSAS